MMRCLVLGTYLLALVVSSSASEGWMGIKPLHSTRATVEQVLGPPTEGDAYLSKYVREGEYVTVQYSSGPCRKERVGGWNVPLDTVVDVTVTPKVKLTFSDLKLDMEKYKRFDDIEVPGISNYANEEEGIIYAVNRGKVDTIFFGPEAKDKNLACQRPPE